jgi:endonuclease/exonuclease/phosphatase family metal-dependent hydrolase
MKTKHLVSAAAVVAAVGIILFFADRPPMERSELPEAPPGPVTMVSWNVRGYPERSEEATDWLHRQIDSLGPHILCIQEIANDQRVEAFIDRDGKLQNKAFLNSSDGQDNAILTLRSVELEDIVDPDGFQHPAQAAYLSCHGLDVVVVTVHLSWSDVEKREMEKQLLKQVVEAMLEKDPDLIIAGDFNTKEEGIQALADTLGLLVMVPPGQNGVGTTHAGNRYDHFLVSPDLAEEEAMASQIVLWEGTDQTMAEVVSDHVPILTRFRTDSHFRDR